MQGDILFYTVQQSNVPEQIISLWEHSKYVHCAIDMGDTTKIEAI